MLARDALALPPTLTAVGEQHRHPTATFSAPKASDATIYFATKPDRASDGSFLTENVKEVGLLTDAEIQAGKWLDANQVHPGTYYVMVRAFPDFDGCYIVASGTYDPTCADGFSNVLTLVVKKPVIRYTARVKVYKYRRQPDLRLTATPLGEKVAYRVCYRPKSGRRRCLNGSLDGYSWNSSAADDLTVSTRGLRGVTTFTWYVGTKRAANRRVHVR